MALPSLALPVDNQTLSWLRAVALTHELPARHESYLFLGMALRAEDTYCRRLELATAITRFCSSFIATEGDFTRVSLAASAERKGIWPAVARIRNQCAHSTLPTIGLLEAAANACLHWLVAQQPSEENEDCSSLRLYRTGRLALLEKRNISAFLKVCDERLPVAVISQVISRLSAQMGLEQIREIQNASLSLLDDDPAAMIKRGLQTLYQRAKVPIIAFLTGEKCDIALEAIHDCEYNEIFRQISKIPAENDWEVVSSKTAADVDSQNVQLSAEQVKQYWTGDD